MEKPEYIERNGLLEDIENALVFSGRPGHLNPKQIGARMVVQRIRMAPAADVAPVVHGRRVPAEQPKKVLLDSKCVECSSLMLSTDKHCPNCGARMDGE